MHTFLAIVNLKAVSFQVPVAALAFILGSVCPVLVGIVTKSNADALLKATLLVGLSAFAGLLAVALKNDGWIDLWHYVFYVGAAMFAAFSTYSGWTKHLMHRTNSLGTANFGLGGSKV